MQGTVSTKQITLRAAHAGDAGALYDVLLDYFSDPSCPWPRPLGLEGEAWVSELCHEGASIVAECDGWIVGSVGLEISNFPWNSQARHLFGHWLYVVPEFRAGGTGRRLIEAAKAVARTNHMNLLMGSIWGYRPEQMNRLMQTMGFRLVGSAYLWTPEN